jgi:hypothetical protein
MSRAIFGKFEHFLAKLSGSYGNRKAGLENLQDLNLRLALSFSHFRPVMFEAKNVSW